MSGAHVLELVGDFVEDYEVMVPYQALQMVGHEVDAARPEKDAGDTVKTAVHDFRGDQTYLETRGHDFGVDVVLEDADPADYDALVVPGGRAPEYLRTYEVVLRTVRHFFEADKPVTSICHGPQILAAAGVLDDREITSYPAVRPEEEADGCSWVDGVVRDGTLVTGRAWPDHPEWLAASLDVLGTTVDHGPERAAAED